MDSCQAPDPGDGRLRMRVEAFLEDRSADTVTGPRRMGRTPLVEFVRSAAEDAGLTVWSPGCEGFDVIILDHWSEIPGMEDVITDICGKVSEGDIVRVTFTGSGDLDAMLRLHTSENAEYLSKVLGCTVCEIVVDTAPEIDMDSRASGSDMTAKTIAAGREMASSGRDAIISVITANQIAARHRDYFESLSDERLAELVETAAGFLVARLEGTR